MKLNPFFILILLGCSLLAGCKDHNEPEYTEDADYPELIEDLCYQQLLNTLARNDDGVLIPSVGTVIDAGRPHEVWLLADNVQDARNRFKELLVPAEAEEFVEESGDVITLRLKDALLKFGPVAGNGAAIACVDVDIKELPGLRKIYYTTEDLWPENDNYSPFELGNIWKKGNIYWICIKDSRKGKGIMLGITEDQWVNGVNTVLRYDKYDHFQKYIEVRTQCASKETWMAYRDMRSRYSERLKTNYEEFENLTWSNEDENAYNYDFNRYVLRSFLRVQCNPSYSWDDDQYCQIGSAAVSHKYAWVPAYHYYIVEFDYYHASNDTNAIEHYKTEKKTARPRLMMYSLEFFFDSSLGDPEEKGWECITRH